MIVAHLNAALQAFFFWTLLVWRSCTAVTVEWAFFRTAGGAGGADIDNEVTEDNTPWSLTLLIATYCGGGWRKPNLCTVRIRTLGAPSIRPDTRHVSKARLLSQTLANPDVAIATSLPYRRTAGPNAGLHVPTCMLGIRQTNTSGSIRIDR